MTHARRRPTRAYSAAARSATALEPLEPRTLFSAAPASTPAQLVAQANNAFAFDLLKELAQHNPDSSGNLFFSPYSISTALEMTLQGAKGQTAAEIIQTLHLPSSDIAQAGIQALYQLFQADPATAGYTLSTANRLWVNQNYQLLDSFLTSTQTLFGASPQSIDFSDPQSAADTINAWVSDQTHGKIQNLIAPSMLNSFTTLVLTNAIYFKGDWATPFDATLTHDSFFQSSATQYTADQMMEQAGDFGYYSQSGPNGFQAVDLPYQNNNLDMLVILPTAENLDAFQSSLTPDLFSQITSNLASTQVDVNLPKFQLNESYDLVKPLEDLGINTAFGRGADFTGILQTSSHISDVVHKTFIQVDETGTEATGATGVVGTNNAGIVQPLIPPILFDANHPFLFAIRDRATNTILFLGQVTNPANAALTDGIAPPDSHHVGSIGIGDPVPPISVVTPVEPPAAPPVSNPTPASTPTLSPPVTTFLHTTRGRPILIKITFRSKPVPTHPSHVSSTTHTPARSTLVSPNLRGDLELS